MINKYHTISEIVAAVYCEQKVVFDREHGDATPLTVRRKALHGTFEHQRFALEGRTRAVIDKRCFIATSIYGIDAPQTNLLRTWRDSVLIKSRAGRLFVFCYYRLSPFVVPMIDRSAWLKKLTRSCLNLIISRLGQK
jgi:hypothetical protein